MTTALLLFLIPTILFVLAFLYETYLSFARLRNPKAGKSGYVSATWEITHTLLVTAVVMLLMMFTTVIDSLASAIFLATFLAAIALGVRSALYLHIFYVRTSKKTSWVDWLFAFSHVVAAALLVLVVVQALMFLLSNNPVPNSEFVPYFIPGITVVIILCLAPIAILYKIKD